jgi:hypothetical protein
MSAHGNTSACLQERGGLQPSASVELAPLSWVPSVGLSADHGDKKPYFLIVSDARVLYVSGT